MTSNFIWHCINELKAIGMYGSDDEMNRLMTSNIMELCQAFERQGHSGFSANYCLETFHKLASWKPLAPLTGEDDEWVKHDYGTEPSYQNKRRSSVFKDADGNAYDIDGKVFWEWNRRPLDEDEPGYPGFKTYKSYYTCRESRVPVTFPYVVPDRPIYEYRYSDAEPAAPKQTEEGIIDGNT